MCDPVLTECIILSGSVEELEAEQDNSNSCGAGVDLFGGRNSTMSLHTRTMQRLRVSSDESCVKSQSLSPVRSRFLSKLDGGGLALQAHGIRRRAETEGENDKAAELRVLVDRKGDDDFIPAWARHVNKTNEMLEGLDKVFLNSPSKVEGAWGRGGREGGSIMPTGLGSLRRSNSKRTASNNSSAGGSSGWATRAVANNASKTTVRLQSTAADLSPSRSSSSRLLTISNLSPSRLTPLDAAAQSKITSLQQTLGAKANSEGVRKKQDSDALKKLRRGAEVCSAPPPPLLSSPICSAAKSNHKKPPSPYTLYHNMVSSRAYALALRGPVLALDILIRGRAVLTRDIAVPGGRGCKSHRSAHARQEGGVK
eukprot:2410355-Rhodomonas_salina.1